MIYLQSDFNPRTPCGVRRSNAGIHCCTYPISIHAPLAGCDPEMIRVTLQRLIFQSTHPLRGATSNFDRCRSLWIYFNPRTPCGVRRFATQQCCCETNRFQSTHPLRGATLTDNCLSTDTLNFNPRTPCGVRRCHPSCTQTGCPISIHAPLAGCDLFASPFGVTSSISIHAPLAGCDYVSTGSADG